jgi:hypothetical protein
VRRPDPQAISSSGASKSARATADKGRFIARLTTEGRATRLACKTPCGRSDACETTPACRRGQRKKASATPASARRREVGVSISGDSD